MRLRGVSKQPRLARAEGIFSRIAPERDLDQIKASLKQRLSERFGTFRIVQHDHWDNALVEKSIDHTY